MTRKFLGIAAIVLAIVFLMVTCNVPTGTVPDDTTAVDMAPEIIDGYWWIGGVNTGVPATGATGPEGGAGPAGVSPTIIDGFWWIGDVNTGVPATGAVGATPEIVDGYWWIEGVNTGISATGATGPAGNSPVIIDGYWWIGGVNTDVPATGATGVAGATPEIVDGFWWIGGVNTGVPAKLRPTASITIVCGEGIPITHLDLRIDQHYTLYVRDPDGVELTNILWDSDHPDVVSVHRMTSRLAVATGSSIQIRVANREVVGQTAIITATSLEGGNTLIETFVTVTVYCDGRDRANFIYYYDFGAVGDGETCDLRAIYNAHNEANRLNKPVRADYGATYYISGMALTVTIQTDTDWRDAHFVIDDRNLSDPTAWVFHITSRYYTSQSLGSSVTSLTKGQTNLGRTFAYPSLIRVENNTVRRFIRRGTNEDSGQPQREVFLVDVNGNVCPTTPILWDYERITSSSIRPIDATQLTITGGKFTTIENHNYPIGTYHTRNILIERSNTVMDGFRQYIVDDYIASPYWGLTIRDAANVTIQNSYFTGRILSIHGTYGIYSNRTVNLVLRNVWQTNDITDTACWGIFASNESKNLIFDEVRLSRFDAHRGVHNATIKNSTLGHAGVQAIGSGLLTVENTTIIGYGRFINLRSDYGSTWDGDIIVRNCVFHPIGNTATLIYGSNDGNWDFGYQTFLPRKVTVDNLSVVDISLNRNNNALRVFAPFEQAPNAQFPMSFTEEISIRNLSRNSGYGFIISTNSLFNNALINYQ